jgi:LysR family transcriptional regulator, cys regulon transcriptional activator
MQNGINHSLLEYCLNLKQLRYICEIQKHKLNISLAAQALHTNQPGVSKQLRLLEDELGFEIFVRQRNRISSITPAGRKVIEIARRVATDVNDIRALSHYLRKTTSGTLVVAASHTQATYFLPDIIRRFSAKHPDIRIVMRPAESENAWDLLQSSAVDLVVTGDMPPENKDFVVMSCASYQKVVVVPKHHELTTQRRITLKKLAEYKHVGYEPNVTAGKDVTNTFEKNGLNPNFAVLAISADVIKRCVEKGLGIAVVSQLVYDEARDSQLNSISVGHLFPQSTIKLVLPRHLYLRDYTFEFIELCGKHLTRSAVHKALSDKK